MICISAIPAFAREQLFHPPKSNNGDACFVVADNRVSASKLPALRTALGTPGWVDFVNSSLEAGPRRNFLNPLHKLPAIPASQGAVNATLFFRIWDEPGKLFEHDHIRTGVWLAFLVFGPRDV